MKSIFKEIIGYEGLYSINTNGDVFSHKKNILLKPSVNKYGYLQVALCKNGKPSTKRVNVLVAKTFVPNPDRKPIVNHKDGNKLNNRVENLEWCTYSENSIHARDMGLSKVELVRIVETGEVFVGAKECARHIHGNHADIYGCLNGKRKTHKGYHFERVTRDESRRM